MTKIQTGNWDFEGGKIGRIIVGWQGINRISAVMTQTLTNQRSPMPWSANQKPSRCTDQIKCSHSITDRGCFFTSSHNNYVDTECFITLTPELMKEITMMSFMVHWSIQYNDITFKLTRELVWKVWGNLSTTSVRGYLSFHWFPIFIPLERLSESNINSLKVKILSIDFKLSRKSTRYLIILPQN